MSDVPTDQSPGDSEYSWACIHCNNICIVLFSHSFGVLAHSDSEELRIVAYLDTQGQRINLTNNVVPVSPNIKVYQSYTMLKNGIAPISRRGPDLGISVCSCSSYTSVIDSQYSNRCGTLRYIQVLCSFGHFSTSYDRWNEGRKDFGALTSDVSNPSIHSSDLILAQIRNMARNIWTCVNLPPEQSAAVEKYMNSLPVYLRQPHPQRTDSGASSSTAKHTATAQNLGVAYHLRNEKIRAIKLLVAFAVATKASLVICHVERFTDKTLNSTIYETNQVWIMTTIPGSYHLLSTEKRHPVGKGPSLPALITSSRQQKPIQTIHIATLDLTFCRTESQLPRRLS